MGILDRLFKRREVTAVKMVTEQAGAFTTYCGDAYSSDIYRGAVDAIARNIGKLKGSHVIRYADHDKVDGDCRLNRLLQVRPNPCMSAYDFLYKLATHYKVCIYTRGPGKTRPPQGAAGRDHSARFR